MNLFKTSTTEAASFCGCELATSCKLNCASNFAGEDFLSCSGRCGCDAKTWTAQRSQQFNFLKQAEKHLYSKIIAIEEEKNNLTLH
jgi:hypothetical protein